MQKILSAAEMKACDNATIESYKVPSLVLMERAALAVCDNLAKKHPFVHTIGIFCGPGNNGGDGVAIGRILHNKGVRILLIILGNPDKFSEQLRQEIEIAKNYGMEIIDHFDASAISDCQIFIDALFGIGLTRGLDGEFAAAANYMNHIDKPVIAVDIPSGYDTDSGRLLGEIGVNADMTVTFAYPKKGLLLGECKAASGDVRISDVGIYCDDSTAMLLDASILQAVPTRAVNANKGTCGKVLIIAGSESIYGACYLAAKAALKSGSGLVKIYTHANNMNAIQQNLPEAMYSVYTNFHEDELRQNLKWADTVIIGPGLGTSPLSKKIMQIVAKEASVPTVIDADGLNILSEDLSLLDFLSDKVPVILTPHLKEMERLCGTAVNEINYHMEETAKSFATTHHCVVVLKNHTEVISDGDTTYYCNSGNESLATPGSGDVLAGIIGALLGQGMDAIDAAAAGAFIHGRAGTTASLSTGIKGLLASDIINALSLL